jgi:hypothetical protein
MFFLNQSSIMADTRMTASEMVSAQFGTSFHASTDGLVMVVGCPGRFSSSMGEYGTVSVFTRPTVSSKTWTFATRLMLDSIPTTQSSQYTGFGQSVWCTADGSLIVVGEPQIAARDNGYNGRLHLFSRTSNNSTQWVKTTSIECPGGCYKDGMGYSGVMVSMDGKRLIAASPTEGDNSRGKVRVWSYAGTTSWTFVSVMSADSSDYNSQMGLSLDATSDGRSIAAGSSANKVYLFREVIAGSYTRKQVITESETIGYSVAFDRTNGNVLFIGAVNSQVYVYTGPADMSSQWARLGSIKFTDCVPSASTFTKVYVSLSDDGKTMLIGGESALTSGASCVLLRTTSSPLSFVPIAVYRPNAVDAVYRFSASGTGTQISGAGTTAVMGASKSFGYTALYDSGLCAPGYEPAAPLGCRKCKSGSYSILGAVCELCAAGTAPSSVTEGATSADICVSCPVGTYSPGAGTMTCLTCPVGTYNDQIKQSACQPCPQGTYMPTEGSPFCSPCPVNTYTDKVGMDSCRECGVGARTRGIKAASIAECEALAGFYWDESKAVALQCSPRDACVGGKGPTGCADGYTGFMCASCRDGYFRNEGGRCEGCPSFPLTQILAVAIVILAFIIMAAYYPLRTFLTCALSAMAPVIQYFQILAIVASVRVGYASSASTLFQLADLAMFRLSFFKPECITANMDVIQQWLLAFSPMATILVMLTILFVVFTRFVQRLIFGSEKAKLRRIAIDRTRWAIVGVMVSLLNIFFLPLLRLSFLAWDCSKVGNAYLLDADPRIECYNFGSDSKWFSLVVLGLLSLSVLGIPWVTILCTMYRACHNSSIDSERFRAMFGGVTQDFRAHKTFCVLWGVAIQKLSDIFVLSVQVFQSDSPLLQCLSILVVLECYVIPFVLLRPCKHKATVQAMGLLMISLQAVLLFGMVNAFIAVGEAVDNQTGPDINSNYIPVQWWILLVALSFTLIFMAVLRLLFPFAFNYQLLIIQNQALSQSGEPNSAKFANRKRLLRNFLPWVGMQYVLATLMRAWSTWQRKRAKKPVADDISVHSSVSQKLPASSTAANYSAADWMRYCDIRDNMKSFHDVFDGIMSTVVSWPEMPTRSNADSVEGVANVVVQIYELLLLSLEHVRNLEDTAKFMDRDKVRVKFESVEAAQRFHELFQWYYVLLAPRGTLEPEDFTDAAMAAHGAHLYVSFREMCHSVSKKPRLIRCFEEFLAMNPLSGTSVKTMARQKTVEMAAVQQTSAPVQKPPAAKVDRTAAKVEAPVAMIKQRPSKAESAAKTPVPKDKDKESDGLAARTASKPTTSMSVTSANSASTTPSVPSSIPVSRSKSPRTTGAMQPRLIAPIAPPARTTETPLSRPTGGNSTPLSTPSVPAALPSSTATASSSSRPATRMAKPTEAPTTPGKRPKPAWLRSTSADNLRAPDSSSSSSAAHGSTRI